MKGFRQKIITDIFTKLGKDAFYIWFSGIKGAGEHKEWYNNGQLSKHEFWKGGRLEGERKVWRKDGTVMLHSFWKNGREVRDLR